MSRDRREEEVVPDWADLAWVLGGMSIVLAIAVAIGVVITERRTLSIVLWLAALLLILHFRAVWLGRRSASRRAANGRMSGDDRKGIAPHSQWPAVHSARG